MKKGNIKKYVIVLIALLFLGFSIYIVIENISLKNKLNEYKQEEQQEDKQENKKEDNLKQESNLEEKLELKSEPKPETKPAPVPESKPESNSKPKPKPEQKPEEKKDVITKDNILSKLDGNWKTINTTGIDGTMDNEGLYLYLIFKNNKVMYTGFSNHNYQDVNILSLNTMTFGGSAWKYEYIDENTITHNGNLYKRVSDSNKDIANMKFVQSSVSKPILEIKAVEVDKISNYDRYYLMDEYIKISNINSKNINYDMDSYSLNINGYYFLFRESESNNESEKNSIICRGTEERKSFNDCIFVD